jgi:DNA-binding transcriptional MocR family regulator
VCGVEQQTSVRGQYSPDTLCVMSNDTVRRRVQRESSEQTRVEECVQWARQRIHGQVFRPGMRLPSIRALARERGVSPFTVAEAYARLVAAGYVEPRRGSGYYVRTREATRGTNAPPNRESPIDLTWLLHHMLESGTARGPGLGVLPSDWLDGADIASALRALGRGGATRWLASGTPFGHEALRSVLQQRLAKRNIVTHRDGIVLTTGITHALNLVLRVLVAPGDTVLVFDPCWFGALGVLAAHGARVVGVPCAPAGPDLDRLAELVAIEKPRLLVASSAAQNPTGLSLSSASVKRIVEIATRAGVMIFEDDAYADLCSTPIVRLAAIDGLARVIHAGSFSKTLAANMRVGFIACDTDLAATLADTKILTGFTTPEINERLVHKLLVENHYDRYVGVLRTRLEEARAKTLSALRRHGIGVFGEPRDGLFAWVDVGGDTNALAAHWRDKGLLLAPGGLFSPTQAPSPWMRWNFATPHDAALTALLRSLR